MYYGYFSPVLNLRKDKELSNIKTDQIYQNFFSFS